jgi:hypothetical protein
MTGSAKIGDHAIEGYSEQHDVPPEYAWQFWYRHLWIYISLDLQSWIGLRTRLLEMQHDT